MLNGHRLPCVVGVLVLASAVVAQETVLPPEPAKLTAYAFVSVRSTKLASKATRLGVVQACRKAVPQERFASLTVATEGNLKDAQLKASAEGAKVFLHVSVGAPKRITCARRVPIRRGRRRGSGSIEQPFYTLRVPVMVEMSIPAGNPWRSVRTVKITSAQAAGAEDDFPADDKDISKAWPQTAAKTVTTACEQVLVEYFLRNIKLRAIECDPAPAAGDDDDDQVPSTVVKFELVNRSHCRVLDATVTVESYDRQFKRWEPVGAPRGLRRWLGRRAGQGRTGQATDLRWPVPAIVDSGEKAFSEERPVPEAIFNAMNSEKCRIVLHATPATTTLKPPTYPAALKPTPKPNP